ncbi:MAG: type III-A CRISPR-associated RAMP protein Csm5 [Spirochaetia bacterium]|nr:type III-A CRISPR-associated RAMP protein Csm5 [Spirochaetia bacterium]
MEEKWTTYPVVVEIITPVIINTGEVYECGELFYDENVKRLYQLRVDNLLAAMNKEEADRFVRIVSTGVTQRNPIQFHEQMKLVSTVIGKHPDQLRNIIARPMGFTENGQRMFSKKPWSEVSKIMTRKFNEKPYLPGSSIKGALRTAILEQMRGVQDSDGSKYTVVHSQGMYTKYIKSQELDAKILSDNNWARFDIKSDPFKFIRVSDFDFSSPQAKVILGQVSITTHAEPIEYYTGMSEATCLGEECMYAEGSISISSRIKETALKSFFSVDAIFHAVDEFYFAAYNNHREKLPISVATTMDKLLQPYVDNRKPLLRLGKYNGIENKTYNIDRDSDIRPKMPQDANKTGTSSCATVNGRYLPGYCVIYKKK